MSGAHVAEERGQRYGLARMKYHRCVQQMRKTDVSYKCTYMKNMISTLTGYVFTQCTSSYMYYSHS
jgi:hypothetical protein